MGTGSLPGAGRTGSGADPPRPSSAEVLESVELYLYSLYGLSWPIKSVKPTYQSICINPTLLYVNNFIFIYLW